MLDATRRGWRGGAVRDDVQPVCARLSEGGERPVGPVVGQQLPGLSACAKLLGLPMDKTEQRSSRSAAAPSQTDTRR